MAAIVTSIRSFSWPEAVTSRPVTDPPDDSTAVVSWETAVPLAGTSSLTVIEYETLGAVAMAESFAFLKLHCFASGTLVPVTLPDRRTYRLVAVNDCHLSESVFHHTRSHPFGGTPNRLRPGSETTTDPRHRQVTRVCPSR